jgi:hypothetical protein
MWGFFFKHWKQFTFLCVHSLNDSDQIQGSHPARNVMKVWNFITQWYQPISDRNWLGVQNPQINFGLDEFLPDLNELKEEVCVYLESLYPSISKFLKTYKSDKCHLHNNNLTFSLPPYQSLQNTFSLNIFYLCPFYTILWVWSCYSSHFKNRKLKIRFNENCTAKTWKTRSWSQILF